MNIKSTMERTVSLTIITNVLIIASSGCGIPSQPQNSRGIQTKICAWERSMRFGQIESPKTLAHRKSICHRLKTHPQFTNYGPNCNVEKLVFESWRSFSGQTTLKPARMKHGKNNFEPHNLWQAYERHSRASSHNARSSYNVNIHPTERPFRQNTLNRNRTISRRQTSALKVLANFCESYMCSVCVTNNDVFWWCITAMR